jgi:hypothetical protein
MNRNCLLAPEIIAAGRTIVGDCSDAVILGIDARELGRTLGGIMRSHAAGLVSDEEALLYARAHWALAALKALRAPGARR